MQETVACHIVSVHNLHHQLQLMKDVRSKFNLIIYPPDEKGIEVGIE